MRDAGGQVLLVVAVTVYPVTAEPPSLAGGVKATAASPLPDVTETPEGAPGVEAAGAITDTVPSLVLVANTVFLTSSTATPNEPLPTVTVWVTVLVCSKHTDRCPGVLDSPGG